ncbi:hypothetical protein G6F62_001400 [Rhizopus arrhizus]|nr:hypothetical protein G6F23_009093 [Rhizopus arrhizus]KAG1298754.1 hypothetical protein G6F66_001444 [Rhizopus arrhizus]KAG1357666.1 hypothetical protein G6F62_001400 [Rhizopus arrhizus]
MSLTRNLHVARFEQRAISRTTNNNRGRGYYQRENGRDPRSSGRGTYGNFQLRGCSRGTYIPSSTNHSFTNTTQQQYATYLNEPSAIDAPIIIGDYVFPVFPAYSSENVLHKINLTSVMCEMEEFLKSRLFSTFERFGSVKDTVIYHDDINCEWLTGNDHVYLEIPKVSQTPLKL